MTKERIQLQILYYQKENISSLSEWVPFSLDTIKATEEPIEWVVPIDIFTTTSFLYPKDQINVERLISIPRGQFAHIGMQVKVKLGLIGNLFAFFRKQPLRWTTTRILIK